MDEGRARRWCGRLSKIYRRSYGGGIAAFATSGDVVFEPYGKLAADRPRQPDEDTLFEIGSITKVFTALLLAKLITDGRIDPSAPIGNILPELSGAPEWITPRALSTHSAGLPRIPVSVMFKGPRNPYADFRDQDLVAWVKRYRPARGRKPDAFNYSNLGVGLLGYVLGHVAGCSYEIALQDHILLPLGLRDTRFDLDDAQMQRLATPHASWGRPVQAWDFDALAGAGALRSSAGDLVKFGRAVIAAKNGNGSLAAAIVKTLEVQIPGKKEFMPDRCLGWGVLNQRETKTAVYNHDGGTRGSSASLFVCPEAEFVLLALANTQANLLTAFRQIKADPNRILKDIIVAGRAWKSDGGYSPNSI